MHRISRLFALLSLAAAFPLAAQQTIAVNGRGAGELGPGDPERGGSYYDDWQFMATAGASYVILLRSDDFDTYLAAGYEHPVNCETCVWDDDGWALTHSRLVLTAQVTGLHQIRVTSFQAGAKGAYTLRVEPGVQVLPPVADTPDPPMSDPWPPDSVVVDSVEYTSPDTVPSAPAPAAAESPIAWPPVVQAPDPGTPPPRLLWAGARDTSWITPYHPREDGVLTEVWWFAGEAGQTVTIKMQAGFPALLRVLEETPDRQPGRELARADGAGGAARVVLTLPRTGSYRVYAGAPRQGATGQYTLTLRH